MNELFRLKIASKRQMTAPQRLLDALSLSEGDEIQIEVADGNVVGVHACKTVPTALLSEDLLSKIKTRENHLLQGRGLTVKQALQKVERDNSSWGSGATARVRSARQAVKGRS